MTILIRDGWPYRHPELQVKGLDSREHVNDAGYVCLWAQGDPSQAWRTLSGWSERIAEWCKKQEAGGFSAADTTMDAHAYFGGRSLDALAVFDLDELKPPPQDGDAGDAHGGWRKHQGLLEITTDRTVGGKVRGVWFYRAVIPAPPTSLNRLRELLTEKQATRFDKLVHEVAHDRKKHRRFLLLIWAEGAERNALVVLLEQSAGNQIHARSIEFAPTDTQTLKARTGEIPMGSDSTSIIVFGAGAIGSHLALLLAESGISSLTLVDGERLRPGNVVRHVAPAQYVGERKVTAVSSVIAGHAPWTRVELIDRSPWEPHRLQELIQGHDVVIDATGNQGFCEQLSVITAQDERELVSAALYRRGAVGRVQRQGVGDTPLLERTEAGGYSTIPKDPRDEPIVLEPGCSAPVNLAPPRRVVACALLASEIVTDALGARALPDEVTEIYRALGHPPYDRTGRITSDGKSP